MTDIRLVGWPTPRGTKFRRIGDDVLKELEKRTDRSERELLQVAYEGSPVGKSASRHPRIRDSWEIVKKKGSDELSLTLTNTAAHLRFYVEGTDPHQIRPLKARVLRWRGSGGTWAFARVVNHPGTKPHDLGGKVLDKAQRTLTALADDWAKDAVDELRDVFVD